MTYRVAINGFGRIGRNIVRAVTESGSKDIDIVAVNDLASPADSAHLLKYDSVHGVFNADVHSEGDKLIVNGHEIKVLGERDPGKLPHKDMGIDLVMECTGLFTQAEKARAHLDAGASKVLISAPAKGEDITVVYGVNHDLLNADHRIISNASCTTNCLAPVAKVLHETVGIDRGFMTTIHAYTNDQRILDQVHSDMRRARAAAISMIPTTTGAARAVGLVLPALKGRLDGTAVRVPTPNVSVVDLTFDAGRETSAEEINNAVKAASQDALKGVLEYVAEPLVSIDFNHSCYSSCFDSSQTLVVDGRFVRVLSWYDNEWGFSNRMIDVTRYIMGL